MVLEPEIVYHKLLNNDRICLSALPRTHGIYALFDHEGAIRYIGITLTDQNGFYGRINNRHVTGSEVRSHKFAHAYNTGRMWRAKGDAGIDARLAKGLRTHFVRRHCRATVLPVARDILGQLPAMEAAVQASAPIGQLLWLAKRGFDPYAEPKKLLDQLLSELAFTPEQHAAIDRQKARSC